MIPAMHAPQDTQGDLCMRMHECMMVKLLRIKDHLAVDDCRHDCIQLKPTDKQLQETNV